MGLKSATMAGGSSGKHERHPSDFYVTPPEATHALMDSPYAALLFGMKWEPACGDGAISKVLIERGHKVLSTDLVNRGYGVTGVDFLKQKNSLGDSIITNPPFDLAEAFIRHCAGLGVPFAMILKGHYWHAHRGGLFADTRPVAVLPLLWRPAMAPERGKSATMEFAWTIWGPKPSTEPCLYLPTEKPKPIG